MAATPLNPVDLYDIRSLLSEEERMVQDTVARFTFPGQDALFLVTLAILMVPYGTLLIPFYVLLHAVGLVNSLLGLCLVLTLFQLRFATYMMRISFEAVPRELEESALVDGAGRLALLRRVFLPAVRPGLITVALFAFLAAWNDFIAPLILISDDSKSPLPLAIASLRQQTTFTIDYGATEAGVVSCPVRDSGARSLRDPGTSRRPGRRGAPSEGSCSAGIPRGGAASDDRGCVACPGATWDISASAAAA